MEFSTKSVVMHDVLREMALWIASDFGKHKEAFVVRAGVGLHEILEAKDWGAVRRMSFMKNNIEEIRTCSTSKCSELTTLLLQNNEKLKNLSGEFIQSIVVLDLSDNERFIELPEQISQLASLQYLDLSKTKIEQLPIGFYELKKLTHLDLTSTTKISSLGGISKLWSLRILKLLGSKVHGDVILVKELKLLENLQVLTITISTEMGLEEISDDQRLANCITDLEINDFQEKPFNISFLVRMNNLRELWVIRSHVSEIDTYMEYEEIKTDSSDLHSPTIPCFTNLSSVYIYICHSIKDLTWLLFAPNIVYLSVASCREVGEIINKEKATTLIGNTITPFQKLVTLDLDGLPKLENIYGPLPFPFLKNITVSNCPKLRKLPLKATSVSRLYNNDVSSKTKN